MDFSITQEQAQDIFRQVKGRQLTINKLIGRGGFKCVFEVHDQDDNRFALKIADPAETDLNRLSREARVMVVVTSPYVPRVYDWGLGETIQYPYLLEEFIEGESLAQILKQQPVFPPSKLLDFLQHILQGLLAFAEQQIVHRDIKPANIMIRSNGTPVLIDFGISRHLTLTTLTSSGHAGPGLTLEYAPPEMLDVGNYSKDRIVQTTDLFSLGIVVYLMATGRHPFLTGIESQQEKVYRMLNSQPIAPTQINPQIPSGLSELILKLLRRETFKRFRSVEEALRKTQELSS